MSLNVRDLYRKTLNMAPVAQKLVAIWIHHGISCVVVACLAQVYPPPLWGGVVLLEECGYIIAGLGFARCGNHRGGDYLGGGSVDVAIRIAMSVGLDSVDYRCAVGCSAVVALEQHR